MRTSRKSKSPLGRDRWGRACGGSGPVRSRGRETRVLDPVKRQKSILKVTLREQIDHPFRRTHSFV